MTPKLGGFDGPTPEEETEMLLDELDKKVPAEHHEMLNWLKGACECYCLCDAGSAAMTCHACTARRMLLSALTVQTVDKALYTGAIAAATELRKERDRLIDELSYADLRASGGLPEATAPTDDLVNRFAAALKEKLRAAEQKYGFSNDWLKDDWQGDLIAKLLNHVQKGDPREDWDYVSFASYSADMDELAQRSAGIIDQQRREIDRLKLKIWVMLMAAGGKLSIPIESLIYCTPGEIEELHNECHMTLEMRAIQPAHPAAGTR